MRSFEAAFAFEGEGEGAKRPYLPPAFFLALSAWASCAVCLDQGRASYDLVAFASAAVIAAATLFATASLAVLIFGKRIRALGKESSVQRSFSDPSDLQGLLLSAAFLFLGIAVGCFLGLSSAVRLHAGVADPLSGSVVEVELANDARKTPEGWTAEGRLRSRGYLPVRVSFHSTEPHPCMGARIRGKASAKPIDYEADRGAWVAGQRLDLRLSDCMLEPPEGFRGAVYRVRLCAIEFLLGDAEDEARSVICAMVCGFRGDLPESDAYRSFRSCGLAHMVAVSGAHLAVIAALLSKGARLLRFPWLIQQCILAFFLGAYLLFSGASPSALRATFMVVSGLMALGFRRRTFGINALSLFVVGIIALDPHSSLSVSLALSATATLGISLFGPLVTEWVRIAVPIAPRAVSELLGITLSANILSLPLSVSLFSQLPLVSPVANVLVAPFFPFICATGLGAAVLALSAPQVAEVFLTAAHMATRFFIGLVEFLASVPFASIPFSAETLPACFCAFAVAFLIFARWPLPSAFHIRCACAAIVAGGLVFAMHPLGYFESSITMIDVGQGDAFLIRSEGRTLLVDTGRNDSKLVRELARNRVTRIDALMITHADDDHCASLDALSGAVPIDTAVLATGASECSSPKVGSLVERCEGAARQVAYVEAGDALRFGAVTVSILGPSRVTGEEWENEESICAYVVFDVDGDGNPECRALFTGDAGTEQISRAFEKLPSEEIDIFKAGHHGSRGSLDDDLAKSLSPSIALVSVGDGNRYGHPHAEVIESLSRAGSSIYRTDRDGSVCCKISNEGVSVLEQR